jgi:hypothetical protein
VYIKDLGSTGRDPLVHMKLSLLRLLLRSKGLCSFGAKAFALRANVCSFGAKAFALRANVTPPDGWYDRQSALSSLMARQVLPCHYYGVDAADAAMYFMPFDHTPTSDVSTGSLHMPALEARLELTLLPGSYEVHVRGAPPPCPPGIPRCETERAA